VFVHLADKACQKHNTNIRSVILISLPLRYSSKWQQFPRQKYLLFIFTLLNGEQNNAE
jgi:hypothetical protein